MPLLRLRQTAVKQPRLTEVVLELLTATPDFDAFDRFRVVQIGPVRRRREHRAAQPQSIREVGSPAVVDLVAVEAVALVVPHGRDGLVDGNLREVWSTQPQ